FFDEFQGPNVGLLFWDAEVEGGSLGKEIGNRLANGFAALALWGQMQNHCVMRAGPQVRDRGKLLLEEPLPMLENRGQIVSLGALAGAAQDETEQQPPQGCPSDHVLCHGLGPPLSMPLCVRPRHIHQRWVYRCCEARVSRRMCADGHLLPSACVAHR